MRFRPLILVFLLVALVGGGQHWAELGDFSLESGEVIQNCRIGYHTFGQLNDSRDNAILFPTWFGGTSEHLGSLVGPDKLLDSTRYFIIAIDALGNGVSSSPSNSTDQPGDDFPLFSIRDMVKSQYLAVTEHLDIDHLYAVFGGSMGGMQTFQWLVSYPGFMDKGLTYVGVPWQTSFGRLTWELELRAIETGKEYNLPPEVVTEQVAMIQVMNAYTPAYRNRKTAASETKEFRDIYVKRFSKNFKPADWASQLRAMMTHDISTAWDGDHQAAAAAIQANVMIIMSAQDHLVPPQPALEIAQLMEAETYTFDNDCGHLAPGCEMDKFVQIVHEFLDQ